MITAKLTTVAAMVFVALTIAGFTAVAKEKMQNKPVMITPAEIKWTPGPPSLPPGAKMVLLEGDPKRSEMVSMRILLPRNYKLMPHTHPDAERVTVVSGTLFFGPGEKMDKKKAKKLPAGSFFVMPPNTPMFGWTEDQETVIQINVMGPWDITYINPADDPRKKK